MSSADETVIESACRAVWGEAWEAADTNIALLMSSSQRAYHTLHHVAEVLRLITAWEPTPPPALLAAALYHDAVYDPRNGAENEKQSADLCRSACQSVLSEEETAEAERLILLTITHNPTPDDRNGILLTCADLWVLGGTPNDYATYAQAIRQEYAHVPDDAWRTGRARVLRTFLEREHIYPASSHTPAGTDTREAAARHNLQSEIATLETRTPQP